MCSYHANAITSILVCCLQLKFCRKKRGAGAQYILVAVTSSGILKAKQKLGVTFNTNKLGGIDFTKISKLTMCSG